MEKLDFVSKEYIATLGIDELYNLFISWASKYNSEILELANKYPDYTREALNIERELENPPKRFQKMSDIPAQLTFFYDEEYDKLEINMSDIIPTLKKEDISKFLSNYLAGFDLNQTKEEWFSLLKEIAINSDFALNKKEFID
jgi:glutamyl-tRNA synthetase